MSTERVTHRDWYIDEGASNPLTGALASVSSTLTNTIVSFSTYSHDLHNTIHHFEPSIQEPEPQQCPENEVRRYPTLNRLPSRLYLEDIAHYPPEHITRVADRMASKQLPSSSDAKKYKAQFQKAYTLDRAKSINLKTKPQTQHHPHTQAHEAAHETGDFIGSLMENGLKSPIAFLYNMANGFHNAPSFVLHDETVRRRDKITGFGSGVKVAAKGFVFNLTDSVTGLVYLPYLGCRKEGLMGLGKGVGKSIGGIVFKTTAAVIGVPAYTLKGVEKQVEKRYDRGLKARILEVRLRQGLAAYGKASAEEKQDILRRWKEFEEKEGAFA